MIKLFSGGLQIGAGIDLNSSLSRLTGMGFENSMMKLKFGDIQVTDGLGNMDVKAFRDVVKNSSGLHVSDLDICNELSKVTGSSFENVLMKMNKIDLKPLK